MLELVVPAVLIGMALTGFLVWRGWSPLNAVLGGAGVTLVLVAYRAALEPTVPAAEALVLFAALGGSLATSAVERHRAGGKSRPDGSRRTT